MVTRPINQPLPTLASKRGVMRALRACQFTYREGDPVVCGQGSDALTSAARAAVSNDLENGGLLNNTQYAGAL